MLPRRRQKKRKKFDKLKNVVLECKASLITVKQDKTISFVRFVKNLQPISVGVWRQLPSSSEQSRKTLNAHEVKKMWNSEMKFMSIPIYELLERAKKSRSNYRVWSWLRLNAGGMPYTCKSNGSTGAILVASGERVSNTSERAQSWGITQRKLC